MENRFNEISDILNNEGTLPINWDASGKMSISNVVVGSEENLLNLDNVDGRFDRNESPLEFSRFNNDRGDNEKTHTIRTAFSSMPDLSVQRHNQAQSRSGPNAAGGGSVVSAFSLNGGRVTPTSGCTTSSTGRHYTLKEYEQQLSKLQKENFNLKARIWHLEEEYKRRGGLTDDMAKRDLEGQISDLAAKLEDKERMLKESLDVLNQYKTNCHRQLTDFKRDHEAEMDTVRRQFSERINALEQCLNSANEQLDSMEQENQRLSQLVSFGSGHASLGGESDSDVSLISHRERENFDLKARVAMLERALQSTSSGAGQGGEGEEKENSGLSTPRAKTSSNSAFDAQTLRYEQVEMEALQHEVKEKDELIAKLKSKLDEKDDFISRLQFGNQEKDGLIGKLESGVGERDQYIDTLESNLQEKNQAIDNLESEIDRLKTRLDNALQNQNKKTSPSNNSDDEKLRQMEEELIVQRANALKNTKIIQGLLKQIRNERINKAQDVSAVVQTGDSLISIPGADIGSGDYVVDENEIDPDSSTFVAWLNETTRLQARQHDDLFRRRVAELQTVTETVHDRLKRVADSLEDYAQKLPSNGVGIDSSQILSAISRDLSHLREDLHESSLGYDAAYIEELRREKEKCERYAKKLKAKYRQILKFAPTAGMEAKIDEWLTQEKNKNEEIDGVVRQLEENNQILGERFQEHQLHDKKVKEAAKRDAAKVKDLKRQLHRRGKEE